LTDDTLSRRVESSRRELQQLTDRGRQLKAVPQIDAVRAWQHDCAGLVHELSGGSKAHWLARAYSDAFLVRSGEGGLVVEAPATEIIDRILAVLRRADESLVGISAAVAAGAAAPAGDVDIPSIRRFDFVRNAELRPVLEQAFLDSARAFEIADYASALTTSCVILEAIITDALQGPYGANIAEWSFADRIVAAEKSGLIRGGCARLPPAARAYREGTPPTGTAVGDAEGGTVSERDARLTRQVLLVIMRDLNPTR
jgi:hypothetical protein